ncbi:MAG: hypothetical protein PWP27_1644 [Clostridiales bacterium]|nr:hypothetical protein [Clostridiales bacterium]
MKKIINQRPNIAENLIKPIIATREEILRGATVEELLAKFGCI